MAKYTHVRCTGCGYPLTESLIRKSVYIEEFNSDTPNRRWRYALYLCENCASAFDKPMEYVYEWERAD